MVDKGLISKLPDNLTTGRVITQDDERNVGSIAPPSSLIDNKKGEAIPDPIFPGVKVPGTQGGGQLGSKLARMCVSESEGHGSFFGFNGVQRVRIFQSKWVKHLLRHSIWVKIYVKY